MTIIAHNYAQVFDVCDRINLVEGGMIAFDKRTSETSVQELTDRVVRQYRSARNRAARAAVEDLARLRRGTPRERVACATSLHDRQRPGRHALSDGRASSSKFLKIMVGDTGIEPATPPV